MASIPDVGVLVCWCASVQSSLCACPPMFCGVHHTHVHTFTHTFTHAHTHTITHLHTHTPSHTHLHTHTPSHTFTHHVQFACYNGWTFIGSPLVGYMEKITLTSKTSLFRTTPPSLSSLAFRGSLELGDVITHTSTEVVLLLEYVVSWKESDKVCVCVGGEGGSQLSY